MKRFLMQMIAVQLVCTEVEIERLVTPASPSPVAPITLSILSSPRVVSVAVFGVFLIIPWKSMADVRFAAASKEAASRSYLALQCCQWVDIELRRMPKGALCFHVAIRTSRWVPRYHTPAPGHRTELLSTDGCFYMHIFDSNKWVTGCSSMRQSCRHSGDRCG
ncbi:hypothetical protein DEU56DRAFT_844685 [Suillus clintonianus]|uniref:uncharacterized protein n=1 Tax=Suillus clintonianus TaxID=1904413 RepID=UPI001B870460|nr:uncharacterized protein DEU56DRAFT_844685 [Suillus clintonianus]KAG2108601.1 hypothetical protein DEU56DRAFT_844685 [Suillus clintonianus]